MLFNIALAGIILLFIWAIFISIFFWQLYNHYNTLIGGSDEKKLKNILEDILKNQEVSKSNLAFLKTKYDKIEEDSLYHLQKIGLARFNPFKDTGGEQSFILALLDNRNTGILLTGLYSRSGTRWYAKRVVDGKGTEHALSEEEQKAVKSAIIVK
jgi:hypothetical protein